MKILLPTLVVLLSILSGTAHCEDATAAAEFRYRIEQAGRVSAAVYDRQGRLLRELLRGETHKPGDHGLKWDGLDRDGTPMSPGEYEWRVLWTPGFKAEYITSLGINPGSASYDAWVGNHGGPYSMALDDTGMYLAAQVTETAPVLLKQSMDGKQRLWTQTRGGVTNGRFQGGVALASDGRGMLYMLQQKGYLQPINAKTGELLVNRHQRKDQWDPLPDELKNSVKDRSDLRWLYSKGGAYIAAHGDTLVICFEAQNSVRWLSKEDGSIVLHDVRVPSPVAVAVDRKENVFVISENRILRVESSGATHSVIVRGLTAPQRVSIDPRNGDILVAEGEPDHRIKRFSATGELKRSYGREGGRRQGVYEPTDFSGVTAIAVDAVGGFVIAEPYVAPRRVAHFNADGELLREWYGGQPYYAWGLPDPRDPTRVWFNPGSWLTLAQINPADGTWRVLENYNQDDLGGGLVAPVDGHRGRWRVLYHEDQRCFLVGESSPQVLVHDEKGLRALTVVSNDAKRLAAARELAGHEGAAKSFRWIDANGDGLPQAAELEFSESDKVPLGNRSVSEKFELLTVSSGTIDEGAHVRVLSTAPTWVNGVPVYPFGDEPGISRIAGEVAVASAAGTGGTRGVGAYRDREGNYYAHFNTGADWHGETWPTYWGGQSRLVKWDADGRLQWGVGRHAYHGGLGRQPHTTPPGYIHVGAAIIGEVRDTVVMTDRVEWMGKVWTKDGLYVGNVLDGRVDDGLPDAVYYWWRTPDGNEAIITSDNATGGAIMEAKDGSVYFFTQGRNSVPSYRIHGWDGWVRHNGRVTITQSPAHAKAKGEGLNAAYYALTEPANKPGTDAQAAAAAFASEPVEHRIDRQIWHGSPRRRPGHDEQIDGAAGGPSYDWTKEVALSIKPASAFAVRWTGEIEAPLTETYIFSVYQRGNGVRLWVDGKQVIFGWNASWDRCESPPIPLIAGRRYAVQLDYVTEHGTPAASLNWESSSLDRRRIAPQYLYPTAIPVVTVPDPRPATGMIPADTFDLTNVKTDNRREYTSGLRHRGIGVPGSYLGFLRIDFGKGVDKLVVRASGNRAGTTTPEHNFISVAIRLDRPDGEDLAKIDILPDVESPHVVELEEPITGIRDVYIVNATHPGWHFINIHGFSFE